MSSLLPWPILVDHYTTIADALKPRLKVLCDRAVQRGADPEDQLFNVGRFNGKKMELLENMDHQPLRAFFRRLSRECRSVISPHRFRHTIATNLMRSPDRNLKTVQTLLGHSSVNVTLEYVEGDLDTIKRALDETFTR